MHNTSFPQIHGRQLNFWKAGGGDNHLFLAPAGNAVANNTLVAGVLTNREWWEGKSVTIRCVINGEVASLSHSRQNKNLTGKWTDAIVHPTRQHHKGVYDPARRSQGAFRRRRRPRARSPLRAPFPTDGATAGHAAAIECWPAVCAARQWRAVGAAVFGQGEYARYVLPASAPAPSCWLLNCGRSWRWWWWSQGSWSSWGLTRVDAGCVHVGLEVVY